VREFFQRMSLEMSGDNFYLMEVDRNGVVSAKLADVIPIIDSMLAIRNCRCKWDVFVETDLDLEEQQ